MYFGGALDLQTVVMICTKPMGMLSQFDWNKNPNTFVLEKETCAGLSDAPRSVFFAWCDGVAMFCLERHLRPVLFIHQCVNGIYGWVSLSNPPPNRVWTLPNRVQESSNCVRRSPSRVGTAQKRRHAGFFRRHAAGVRAH